MRNLLQVVVKTRPLAVVDWSPESEAGFVVRNYARKEN